jgi:biopolymer transport protein ExbD
MTPWRARRPRARLDLTSLIDVVFVLLIFVVIASRFDETGAKDVALPRDAARSSAPENALTVTVTDTDILVAGTSVGGTDVGAAAASKRTASQPVVLDADAKVPYERVFHVLSSLSKEGITDVSLAYDIGN